MKQKKRYIITLSQCGGRRMPLISLLAIWLLLDRIGISDLGWGIYYTLSAILLTLFMVDIFRHKEIDVDIQELLKKHYADTEQYENEDDRPVKTYDELMKEKRKL